MKNRFSIFILTCVTAVMLPSCISSDPAYKQLVAQYHKNPSPNDIVGAWRLKKLNSSNLNLLFKDGGQGLSYLTEALEGEIVKELTWRYAGDGKWLTEISGFKTEIRMTGDKNSLLVKMTGFGPSLYQVYIRQ